MFSRVLVLWQNLGDSGTMKKILIALGVVGLIVVAGLAFAVAQGERILMNRAAAEIEPISLAQLEELLAPSMVVRQPDAPATGPQPVIVQLHGCSGMSIKQQEMWADMAAEEGYTSLIIASNLPRGFDRDRSLSEVCQGKALLGQERAADVLAGLSHLSKTVEIDPDRIYLAGWSHGAWTAMDFLTMDMEELRPAGLSDASLSMPKIDGAILFYPHCGLGSRTRLDGWAQSPDVLALIADADSIVDHEACLKELDKLAAAGVEIDLKIYEGADHAFDYRFLPPENAHWFNEEYALDAEARYRDFLIEQLAQ